MCRSPTTFRSSVVELHPHLLANTGPSVMSANFDPTIFEFIYYQAAGFASSLALAIYEYFITIDQEIDLIWNRKFDTISVIFLLNRYCVFIIAILFFLQSFDRQVVQVLSRKHCCIASIPWCRVGQHGLFHFSNLDNTEQALATSCNIDTVVTIHCRDNLPFQFFVETCRATAFTSPLRRLLACYIRTHTSKFDTNVILITSTATVILIVLLALVATIMKGFLIKRTAGPAHVGHSLLLLILRDGSLYLFAIAVTQALMIFSTNSQFTGQNPAANLVTGPTIVLTPILLSRFIFGFRGFDPSRDGRRDIPTSIRSTRTNNSGPLQFIRNIGASIRMTPARGDDIVEICLEDFPSSSTALSESMKDSDTHFIPRSFNLSVVTEQPRAIV
ncbi:hypothetical protein C8Q75DRAFT_476469 [Abortiporus biennis]|nr:hypothetical protein C8Q75DRAFT_476469 [Abortiporus biennis]